MIIARHFLICRDSGLTRVHDRKGLKYITLDMDSSVSPTHGAHRKEPHENGHFGCMCYHPLFIFNQFGHLERSVLRHVLNVHSADGWKALLAPVIARYAKRDLMRFFRADAAFAIARSCTFDLEAILEYYYAVRLKKNAVLESRIAHRLTRPVGRPSKTKVKRFYEEFRAIRPKAGISRAGWSPKSSGIRTSCFPVWVSS